MRLTNTHKASIQVLHFCQTICTPMPSLLSNSCIYQFKLFLALLGAYSDSHKLLSVDVLPALAHTGCLLILHCFLQELRQHSLRYALIRVGLSEVGDLQCPKWWRSVKQGTMQSAGYRWLICIHSPRNYCHSLWLNGSQ